jgi:hypothetical protein
MTIRYVEVEVDMSDFSDEDIKAEYAERFDTPVEREGDNTERLKAIYHAMRQNRPEAHNMMWDYIRDTLGVTV